jgi:hypothetical protein
MKGKHAWALYQTTANGILPFAKAKVGVLLGEFIHRKSAIRLLENDAASLG